MGRLKLLFDATELSYYLEESGHRAGVFFVALNLFREFKKREDIELTLYCDFKRYYFLKDIIAKVEEFKGLELLNENSIVNLFFAKMNYSIKTKNNSNKFGMMYLSRLYENLFHHKNKKNLAELKMFDAYFSPFTAPSDEILASNLKRFRMIHDIIPILEKGKIPTNKSLWCYRIYNTINKNDFYLTNSECTRRDILNYFNLNEANIKTTLLGVDESFRPTEAPKTEKYVFSLCTLGKRKNLIFAIKNFFKFIEKNKIKDLKLVLAGGIWDRFKNELAKAIGNFDQSKIEVLGYVKDEDLPKLYSNAMMFVYPSLYEGFGLPVLEAMKCGCPVITSNCSSLPEVIGDAGIQIDPNDDEALINAYEKMYYDKFYRELSIERGLIRAKNFSWEKCADSIINFIKSKSS